MRGLTGWIKRVKKVNRMNEDSIAAKDIVSKMSCLHKERESA